MKTYSANASRRNMIDYLLEQTGLKQTMIFGSIENGIEKSFKKL